MGHFNQTCIVTGIPISEGDKVVGLFLEELSFECQLAGKNHMYNSSEAFQPFPVTISGTYNDYGSLWDVDEESSQNAFEYFMARRIIFGKDCLADKKSSIDKPKNKEDFMNMVREGKVFVSSSQYSYLSSKDFSKLLLVYIHKDVFDKISNFDEESFAEEYSHMREHMGVMKERVESIAKERDNLLDRDSDEFNHTGYKFPMTRIDKLESYGHPVKYGDWDSVPKFFGIVEHTYNRQLKQLLASVYLAEDEYSFREMYRVMCFIWAMNDMSKPIAPAMESGQDIHLSGQIKLLKITEAKIQEKVDKFLLKIKEEFEIDDLDEMDEEDKHYCIANYCWNIREHELEDYDDTGLYAKYKGNIDTWLREY